MSLSGRSDTKMETVLKTKLRFLFGGLNRSFVTEVLVSLAAGKSERKMF